MFDTQGRFLRNIGTAGPGSGPCQFDYPHCLALDRNDNLVVADARNNRLQFLTLHGEFITEIKFGTFTETVYLWSLEPDEEPREETRTRHISPDVVCVDCDGRVWVGVDQGKQRVFVFAFV